MALPPTFKGLRREDFPDAPAWMEQFLGVLNQVLEPVVDALSKGLNRADNLDSAKRVLEITSAATAGDVVASVANELKRQPEALWIGKVEQVKPSGSVTYAVTCSWELNSNGGLDVHFQGLLAATKYRITVIYE